MLFIIYTVIIQKCTALKLSTPWQFQTELHLWVHPTLVGSAFVGPQTRILRVPEHIYSSASNIQGTFSDNDLLWSERYFFGKKNTKNWSFVVIFCKTIWCIIYAEPEEYFFKEKCTYITIQISFLLSQKVQNWRLGNCSIGF